VCAVDQIAAVFGLKAPQFVKKVKKLLQEEKRPAGGVHTVTIQKAYCCPAEELVRNALEPFGIPVTKFSEKTVKVSGSQHARLKYQEPAYKHLPVAQQATFCVPKSRANQAEAWLWATGRMIVIEGNLRPGNQTWGEARAGKMPVAWDAKAGRIYARGKTVTPKQDETAIRPRPANGEPWIEPGCQHALEVWSKADRQGKPQRRKK